MLEQIPEPLRQRSPAGLFQHVRAIGGQAPRGFGLAEAGYFRRGIGVGFGHFAHVRVINQSEGLPDTPIMTD